MGGAVTTIRSVLPQGRTLPPDAWLARHRVLVGLLAAHGVGLAIFALTQGYTVFHAFSHVAGLFVLAGGALLVQDRRRIAAAIVSVGLITSSALLVHIWEGHIEGHFHFFVMIVVLALYEDWLPFLLAAGYVVLHHGLAGAIDPGAVYNHGDAVEHPWKWAVIHGLFVTGAGIASVAAWKLNEQVRVESQANEQRFRNAFEFAPIGMTLTAATGPRANQFIQVNRAICEITGYSEEWLLTHGFADISHPDDLEDTRVELERLMSGETERVELEKRYIHADGHVIWANTVVTLLDAVPGQPRCRIAQIQDVTERKMAADRVAYQAFHDQLTGLPNRRSLFADLDACSEAREAAGLILFDLDGFKAYNDAFGHPAGDALLTRLGGKLAAVVGDASAYRMGGDEFCVLVRSGDVEATLEAACAALTEHGEGFSVTASYGVASLPVEAETSAEALRLADQRMYARKSTGSRASAGHQTTSVLLKVLSERNPALGVHLDEVAELCEAVGRQLGLHEEDIAPLLQAACLHDVGKAAIPDDILNKPGPLDEIEWAFMKRHTLIGERILAAAPALTRASKLVRWSHERLDGTGYPDALEGDEIPIGARIIAVCDSYDAMVSQRSYRLPMSHEGAIAELWACAGTQFDPAVVDAFCAVIEEQRSREQREAS